MLSESIYVIIFFLLFATKLFFSSNGSKVVTMMSPYVRTSFRCCQILAPDILFLKLEASLELCEKQGSRSNPFGKQVGETGVLSHKHIMSLPSSPFSLSQHHDSLVW